MNATSAGRFIIVRRQWILGKDNEFDHKDAFGALRKGPKQYKTRAGAERWIAARSGAGGARVEELDDRGLLVRPLL